MKRRGFTLIELLVVVAIIGVLATVVIVNLNSGRVKARDAKRIADLKQISNALELYYDDHNEYLPGTYSHYLGQADSGWASFCSVLGIQCSNTQDPQAGRRYIRGDQDPTSFPSKKAGYQLFTGLEQPVGNGNSVPLAALGGTYKDQCGYTQTDEANMPQCKTTYNCCYVIEKQ